MKTEKLKKVFQWGMAIITAIMVMSCIVMIFNERYIHALVYLTAAIAYLTTFKYVVDAARSNNPRNVRQEATGVPRVTRGS
jgi:c-di-AMP phosphodiesterase-like protein